MTRRSPFDGAPHPAQPGIFGDPSSNFTHNSTHKSVELDFWNDYYNSLPTRESGLKPAVMPRSITQRLEKRISELESSPFQPTTTPYTDRTELLEQRIKDLEERCKKLEDSLLRVNS